MTTLTASAARIPPQSFAQVAYHGEVIRIEHRSGPPVYLVSEADMKTLSAIKAKRFDDASERAMEQYDELLSRLAK